MSFKFLFIFVIIYFLNVLFKITSPPHNHSLEVNPSLLFNFLILLQLFHFYIAQYALEKEMTTNSSTLAQKFPWMEEPGRLQSMGLLRSDTTERLHFHFSLSCIGEGNGNPLQCSWLENPRDGAAWWAAISGVAQSQTQLKRLSSSSSSSSIVEGVSLVA